jgi:hypothetical protein
VRVVAAAVQAPDVIVRHVGDHFQQLGILAEEVAAHIRAVARLEHLILAVDGFFHALHQQPVLVPRQQRIPVRAPDHLDHVPAGAAEISLELLDDLAVAAHGTVEALQVTVHHEHEIVQTLACGHSDRAERFGLIHLTVAHESPHLAPFGFQYAAVLQILHEARLVDRHDRAEPHRDGGKLPEVGHEPGMRIRRQALAIDFLTEIDELLFGDAALEVCAGIDAGRRVALGEDQIAAVALARRMPEVIEADVVERGG